MVSAVVITSLTRAISAAIADPMTARHAGTAAEIAVNTAHALNSNSRNNRAFRLNHNEARHSRAVIFRARTVSNAVSVAITPRMVEAANMTARRSVSA